MTTILRETSELREKVAAWRRGGKAVGVVPTMGALHAGHLSLVEAAQTVCDRVIVTIFVNPRQFDNPEDLAKYPRSEAADAELLAARGVNVVFAPPLSEVYPGGFSTLVHVAGVSEGLCGAGRPGHFDGVATVVAKLLSMTQADRAFFGEKDWQQLQVVRKLARDLNIPAEIVGCPTVRDADGLALSSRNARLGAAERRVAPALHAGLAAAAAAIRGGMPVQAALADAEARILDAGYGRVEYLELRAAEGLAPIATLDGPARLLAAAWLGDVRLIDNIAV